MWRRGILTVLLIIMQNSTWSTAGSNKCPFSPIGAPNVRNCVAATSTIENLNEQIFQYWFCLLKEINATNEMVIIKEETMRFPNYYYDIDEDTTRQFHKGYETCFVGYQGTENELRPLFRCLSVVQGLSCGTDQFCPYVPCPTSAKEKKQKSSCILSLEKLLVYVQQCREPDHLTTNGLTQKMKPTERRCFLKKCGVMNMAINETAFSTFLSSILSVDDKTLSIIELEIHKCFAQFDTKNIAYNEETVTQIALQCGLHNPLQKHTCEICINAQNVYVHN